MVTNNSGSPIKLLLRRKIDSLRKLYDAPPLEALQNGLSELVMERPQITKITATIQVDGATIRDPACNLPVTIPKGGNVIRGHSSRFEVGERPQIDRTISNIRMIWEVEKREILVRADDR